jgi:dipeptidyl aminopeptidase/acylaminoacyl peptidase
MLGCVANAHSQATIKPACLSSENLRHFALPLSPQLSPDGRRVVFALQQGAADLGVSHLWWADVNKPESARQITFSAPSDHVGESQPHWMPDGSAILFLAERGKHRRIYRLPVTGGEASPLKIAVRLSQPSSTVRAKSGAASEKPATAELDVASFEISPDGKWLAILANDPDTPQQQQRKTEKRDAEVVNRVRHPMRVWLYSMEDESLTPVTSDKREALSAAWSADSAELAIVTRAPGDSDDLGPQHSVEIIAVARPHSSRTIAGIPPSVNRLSWSHSGDHFAFLAQSRHNVPPGVDDLYVIASAGGSATDLTPEGISVAGIPRWSPDDATIFVELQQGATVGLARIPVSGGKPVVLQTGFPASLSFATNRAQTGWAFIAEASDRSPQVMFIRGLSEKTLVQLSRINPAWPESGWQRAQGVEWNSSDGESIHGLVFLPATRGCSAAIRKTPIPLIVNVHGGPTGAFLQTFSPLIQLFLAQGWAVLEPNPRGSTGYGWRFVAAVQNDLGDGDYKDIMAGVDWALAHEPIDSHRLGLFGYSYGGEMAGFVEGRTTRFAAIVAGAPVIDQYSEYGTEDGSWYDRWFFGQPWKRPADAWRQSPLARAADARTPLLLLQGEADTTDPLGQSQEMYRALREDHVPVELIEFPRENHGGLAVGILGFPSREPWHGFEARRHILDWFHSHFSPAPK